MKKVLIALLACLLSFLCIIMVVAEDAEIKRVVDLADILTDDQEIELTQNLDDISEKYEHNVVLLTTDGIYDEISDYAVDYYRENQLGYGNGNDGILLVIDMYEREWDIVTEGYANTVFTDDGIDYINGKLGDLLGEDQYAEACQLYAELCDDFLRQAETGKPYDSSNLPIELEEIGMYVLIALGIGLVISFIVVSVMKGQLKSVRRQAAAHNYLKDGSLMITDSRDIYLYRTVTRVPRPKSNSSGSSSRGSSGPSSRGGGKF